MGARADGPGYDWPALCTPAGNHCCWLGDGSYAPEGGDCCRGDAQKGYGNHTCGCDATYGCKECCEATCCYSNSEQCCTDDPSGWGYCCDDVGETCCGGTCCPGQCLTSPVDGAKICCDYEDDAICVSEGVAFCCDGECCGEPNAEVCCSGECLTSPLDGDKICCVFAEKRAGGGREGGGEICVWGSSETCCDGKCCGELGTQECCDVTAGCCGRSGLCCEAESEHCCGSGNDARCCPTDVPCCGGSCCASPKTCCPDNTCKLSSCNLGGATVAVCRGSSADFDIFFTCTNPCRPDEVVSISPGVELPADGIASVTFGAGDCLSRTAVGIVTVAADAPLGVQQVPLHMCGPGEAECTGALVVTVSGPDIQFPGVPEAKEVNTGGFLVLNEDHNEANLVDVTLSINGDLAGGTVRLQHVLGRGKIKVYEGATEITEWWHTWAPGTFSNPTTVKVEGVEVSSLREVGMTLRYEPAGGGVCTDQIKMTVVRVDLDVDSDNDGVVDDADDQIEGDELLPGMTVPLNSDRDEHNQNTNGDPEPDIADNDVLLDDQVILDDLKPLYRTLSPALGESLSGFTMKLLASPPNVVRVWAVAPDQTAAQPVPFDTNLLPDYFAPGGSRTDWAWYIEGVNGVDCGKVKLTLALYVNPGGRELGRDEVYVSVLGARLLGVLFADNHPVIKDSGTAYTYAEWLDNDRDMEANDLNEHHFPVAYTRNTKGAISGASFQVCPDTFGPSGPTNVRGTDFFGKQYLADSSKISVAGNLVTASDMQASEAFPNEVRYLGPDVPTGPYSICWEMSGDGGLTWYPAGVSDNRLFLLFADPSGRYGMPLYETVGWLSCRSADGKSTSSDVVASIWSTFTTTDGFKVPEVHRKPKDGLNNVDGVRMGYWRCGSATASSAGAMLAHQTGNGQCGAWAELLAYCGGVHGIAMQKVEVKPDTSVKPGAEGLLVKSWDFGAPSGTNGFPFLQGVDVTDSNGIEAQDNPNPIAAFELHFVVRYAGSIYDPSYGEPKGSPYYPDTQHENAAIDGFYKEDELHECVYWVARQNPDVAELTYSPWN